MDCEKVLMFWMLCMKLSIYLHVYPFIILFHKIFPLQCVQLNYLKKQKCLLLLSRSSLRLLLPCSYSMTLARLPSQSPCREGSSGVGLFLGGPTLLSSSLAIISSMAAFLLASSSCFCWTCSRIASTRDLVLGRFPFPSLSDFSEDLFFLDLCSL